MVILPKMHDDVNCDPIWYTDGMKQLVLCELTLSDNTQCHMTSPLKKSCSISFFDLFLFMILMAMSI